MQTFVVQAQSVKEVVLKYQEIASMPPNFKNTFSLHKGSQKKGHIYIYIYIKENKTDDTAKGDPAWMTHF